MSTRSWWGYLTTRCPASPLPSHDKVGLGVLPAGVGTADGALWSARAHLPVLIDGVVIGSASAQTCTRIATALRTLKVVWTVASRMAREL